MKDKVWQKYENAKRRHLKVELTADTESIYSAAILWFFAISGLSRDQKHIYAQILVLLVNSAEQIDVLWPWYLLGLRK